MILKLFIYLILFSPWAIESALSQEISTKEQIITTFSGRDPQEWGEVVNGVKTRMNTDEKVLALTFDACGGLKGSAYDENLIRYLETQRIPATLFISGKWMDVNPDTFRVLSRNPLFEIGNHGLNHKPCSVVGRSAHKVKGTKDIRGVFDEIELNALRIHTATGLKPRYFRPGTAYSDEVCVEVANALGYEVVNFNVRGDAGATYSKRQVKEALLAAAPASIILLHMNHPEKETAEGVMEAVPELRKRGFRFVRLSDFGLK